MTEEYTGVIREIIFHNNENGYTVAVFDTEAKAGPAGFFSASGNAGAEEVFGPADGTYGALETASAEEAEAKAGPAEPAAPDTATAPAAPDTATDPAAPDDLRVTFQRLLLEYGLIIVRNGSKNNRQNNKGTPEKYGVRPV